MVLIYSALLAFSIIVSFLIIICIRTSLLSMYAKLDKDAFTPSDYCAVGYNMVFDSYDPKTINETIKAAFAEDFGFSEEDIVYVNPCYDIGDFYKLTEKIQNL